MKYARKPFLITALLFLVALAGLSTFAVGRSGQADSSASLSLEERQERFVGYVDTVQPQDMTPIAEESEPLCAPDCTLSKSFIYKLDGNYRDNGKRIFAHLKSKGFDFQKGDKYKDEVAAKLNNTKLADNLSDSEPIIVDLYNPQQKARVRVHLGNHDKTMSRSTSPEISRLSAEQLMLTLEFYSP